MLWYLVIYSFTWHVFSEILLLIRQERHLEQNSYWEHRGENICLAIQDFKIDLFVVFFLMFCPLLVVTNINSIKCILLLAKQISLVVFQTEPNINVEM